MRLRALALLTGCAIAALAPVGRAQAPLAPVDGVEWEPLRAHGVRLLATLEELKAPLPEDSAKELRALLKDGGADAAAAVKFQKLLDPLCLVAVTINPESRVKAVRGPAPAELRQGRQTVFLVKVQNEAGVTHALTVGGRDVRSPHQPAGRGWLTAVLPAGPLGKTLSGERVEYRPLGLTAQETGKREATLTFDVGQGTQDLGFRAEVPVLFAVKPQDGRK
jgi:hypothetical protein